MLSGSSQKLKQIKQKNILGQSIGGSVVELKQVWESEEEDVDSEIREKPIKVI